MINAEIQNSPATEAPARPILVSVEKVTRRFKDFTAVNNITFEVYEGEIFGFLGANGAGKSTTIKMICTLLQPTSGEIRVAGHDVNTHAYEVRSTIGIVFQDNSLDSGLTAQENLEFHCMMYDIPRAERQPRIANLLALMELTEFKDRIVKTYSGGMRRRLEIARGLLHRPQLLILDEPTVGLDPQTRSYIWQYVRQLRDQHDTAIFMTTHYMDEAEYCDRIAILDHGEIIALDTPAGLKRLIAQDQIDLVTDDAPGAARLIERSFGLTPSVQERHVLFQVTDADRFLPRLFMALAQTDEQVAVESLQVHHPSLEDVFIRLTGRKIREEEGGKDERRLALRRLGKL